MNFADQSGRNDPKCCGCFSERYGTPLVLTSWTGISLYFASLSFMGKSPFYSNLNRAALIVFGVINVLFAAVCLYGFKVHYTTSILDQRRTFSKLLSCFTTVIIADMLCNFIVYCVKHQDFLDWCTDNSKNQIIQQQPSINGISLTDEIAIFNCSKLFEAEVKFSLGITVVVGFVYAFWAIFVSKVSRYFYFVAPSVIPNPNMMVQQAMHAPGTGNIDIQQSNMAENLPVENTQAPNVNFANIPPSQDHRSIPVEF